MSVSKIALGTVQLGLPYGINNHTGQPDEDQAFAILNAAADAGIDMLDTAEDYGTATAVLGKYFLQGGHRFRLVSKFIGSQVQGSFRDHVLHCLDALAQERIYGYMYHRYEELAAKPELLETLLKLQADGRISKIGVSIYSPQELEEVAMNPAIDLVQLPFNLLDNMAQRGKGMLLAAEKGKELHVRSVFLQGLFFMDPEQLQGKLVPLKPFLEKLTELGSTYYMDLPALALNYALAQPVISRVLIGVEQPQQIRENLQNIRSVFPPALRKAVDEVVVEHSELLSPVNWK